MDDDHPYFLGPEVKVGPRVELEPGAVVCGPVELCDGCRIRANATVGSVERRARSDAAANLTVVGAGAEVGSGAVIEGGVTIGSRTVVASLCFIGAGSYIGNGVSIGPGAQGHGPLVIGDAVAIGAGALLHPYTRIGRGTVIGARASIGGPSSSAANEGLEGTRIGERCRIPEGAVVPAGTTLEEGTVL